MGDIGNAGGNLPLKNYCAKPPTNVERSTAAGLYLEIVRLIRRRRGMLI